MTPLRERLAAIEAELRALHTAAGDNLFTAEQQARWDELMTERGSPAEGETAGSGLLEEIRRDDARRALVRSLADRPGHAEPGDGARGGAPTLLTRRDPFELLESRGRGLAPRQLGTALVEANLRAIDEADVAPDNREHFEAVLRRHLTRRSAVMISEEARGWALNLLARSRPEYESAFAKMMMGRAELLDAEERAAIAVGTNTQGGYLLPTHLDPTIILTNSGTSNVIRGISRQVTLIEGTVWHGVTSAGVTASWDGELTEVSDDSPTLAAATVSTDVAQAFVQASIAAFEDIAGLTQDVMMLFADARDRLEGAAHATGLGSSHQPKGIFTACNASSGVQITSTTAATIGEVDIHSVYRSVPVRWRRGGTWLMNPLYSLAVKRLGTALSSAYSGDLTQPVTDRILGRPLVESDDAPTTQTTTALDNELIYGDFGGYLIVDKPGSMSVEFIPQLFNTANNLPDGRRGWFAYWRTGADAINLAGFRMLVDKTSA